MTHSSAITVEKGGERLDVFLSAALDTTRSHVKQLNDGGFVRVNGQTVKGGCILKAGDEIEVTQEQYEPTAQPEDLPLTVLYEDDDVAVIDKRQGMSVHPGAGVHSGTLVNALLYRFGKLSEMGGAVRPGIVHRLDKDTSGVLVVAKNDKAHASLAGQLSRREMHKAYIALLEGNLKNDAGEVRTYIGRNPRARKKMAVLPQGKEAITHYRVIERFAKYCLAEFVIETGRTHQIRVHAQYLGHPVAGDKTYGFGAGKFALDGQLLHAASITFRHPSSERLLTFTAPLPDYFQKILNTLRQA